MSGPVKRSVTLAGHRTSISLEPIFWSLLESQADVAGLSINQFVLQLDASRTTNLSSAIRTYLVEQLMDGND
ncbi:MAG: aryl-sulfate sulfotransferase [Alphaproteobacteria bacterium]|nr:MAG: aryl-sulfate sulfotransferase [Alphaproteobacteria bacterium]